MNVKPSMIFFFTALPASIHLPSSDEDLSDLSDGEGYFHPNDDDSKISMRFLRPARTKLKRVKELYLKDGQVNEALYIFCASWLYFSAYVATQFLLLGSFLARHEYYIFICSILRRSAFLQ